MGILILYSLYKAQHEAVFVRLFMLSAVFSNAIIRTFRFFEIDGNNCTLFFITHIMVWHQENICTFHSILLNMHYISLRITTF